MRMIIHDLTQEEFASLGLLGAKGADIVISDDGTIKNCIGCFGCWVKTPGVCVLKDNYSNMGEKLAACDELTVISRCLYGSYSPFVRNVFDRSIPYVLPYFITKDDETHHAPRYANHIAYSVRFYGEDITEGEKETATRLVRANARNFYANLTDIAFYKSYHEIKEALA